MAISPYSALKAKQDQVKAGAIDLSSNLFQTGLSYENYPDLDQTDLIQKYCQQSKINNQRIRGLITRGSTEGIDLALRWAAHAHYFEAVIPAPTFPLYEYTAQLNGISVQKIPILNKLGSTGLSFQLASTLLDQSENKVLFLCNPSNPLGSAYNPNFIEETLDQFRGLVVIDEAYIEYSQSSSLISKLETHDRIVVLRTLSKAWGLAGARCGFLFSNPELIKSISNYILPFSTPTQTSEIVRKRLSEHDQISAKVNQVKRIRQSMLGHLRSLFGETSVYDSEACFIFIETSQGHLIVEHLAKNQILVEEVKGPIAGVRFGIGNHSDNEHLLQCLNSLLQINRHLGLRTSPRSTDIPALIVS